MNNPIIETDIAEILREIRSDQRKIIDDVNTLKLGQANIEGKIESLDERLSGKIESLDERLSGKIESLDERLSGQIKALDTKTEQLDKRISNSELTNRGIFIGLVVIVLGGTAKFLGFGA